MRSLTSRWMLAALLSLIVTRLPAADIKVSTLHYNIPDVELVREDGRHVRLPDEMNDGRPVVLNFIFTSCGSICPLMSQVFGQFQHELGADSRQVHLMSISIDPEEDTPARLREYALKFGATEGWQHYTGTVRASVATQRAFDVYRGDKMSHSAVTLMRPTPGADWVRLDGFATPSELMEQFREMLPKGIGERIYREGIVSSGATLQADRGPGMHLSGATVACVACHRRSGLGMKEGASTIPPIAGIYLFSPRSRNGDDQDLPFVEGMRADRDPYSAETLARAIRDGIGANGKPLSMLMPRFQLNDTDMAALIDYLRNLSPASVPGVDPTALHFATIITPDADPQTRQGVLDVLNEFFADKNHFMRAQSEHLHSAHRMMFKANRRWALHVWELHGAPDTWEAQLQAKLRAEPVFAVISGAGGHNWTPVHRFCENAGLPCLFPNVDLPVVSEHDFDSLYFSRGVLLEADLIATALSTRQSANPAAHIVQIYREGDVGADAAAHLASQLKQKTLRSEVLRPGAGVGDLAAALGRLRPGDVAVLWLRSQDVGRLGTAPPADVSVYLSGRMAGLEFSPLPAAWRTVTQMSYPYDLPSRSRVQLDYPLGWFRIRKIPVVARQAQIDTFLACQILSDTTNHMADTFVRDYLVERIERDIDHRIINAAYPRLALAQEQRFASKGGYLVHFANSSGPQLLADGQWTVP